MALGLRAPSAGAAPAGRVRPPSIKAPVPAMSRAFIFICRLLNALVPACLGNESTTAAFPLSHRSKRDFAGFIFIRARRKSCQITLPEIKTRAFPFLNVNSSLDHLFARSKLYDGLDFAAIAKDVALSVGRVVRGVKRSYCGRDSWRHRTCSSVLEMTSADPPGRCDSKALR
jgi:hypothetical protein